LVGDVGPDPSISKSSSLNVDRTQSEKTTVVIKSIRGHPRVENERDVLKKFQSRTPYLRPLIDEIQDPTEPPTIVLKFLQDDLLQASIKKPLNKKDIRYLARRTLEALKTLHEANYVHTGL